jgi:hypothetical protein
MSSPWRPERTVGDVETQKETQAPKVLIDRATHAVGKDGTRYRLERRQADGIETTTIHRTETKAARQLRLKTERRLRSQRAMSIELVRAVKTRLQADGVNLSGACGAFRITNEVAKMLNAGATVDNKGRLPWGLLRKDGGNRAVPTDGGCVNGDESSAPGFATDYLIQRDTWLGFDILGNSGGTNDPQWPDNPETTFVERNRQNFANPVNPFTDVPVEPGNPPVDPTDRIAEVLVRLNRIEETLAVAAQFTGAQGDAHAERLLRIEEFLKALSDQVLDVRKFSEELKTLAKARRSLRVPYLGTGQIDPQ